MPTPRLPTALHIAKGSFKKDPQRAKARENEPVIADEIGLPPACFMPIEQLGKKDEAGNWVEHPSIFDPAERQRLRELWFELIADAGPGVLNRSHRWHVESACKLKYKERFGVMKTGDTANLNKAMTQMGMNPAAQSTVSGGPFTPAGSTSAIGRLAAQAQRRIG